MALGQHFGPRGFPHWTELGAIAGRGDLHSVSLGEVCPADAPWWFGSPALQGAWMSGGEDYGAPTEVEELRSAVEGLRLQVASLDRRVRDLEAPQVNPVIPTGVYSQASASAISQASSRPAPSSRPLPSASSHRSTAAPAVGAIGAEDLDARTRLAAQIGAFLRRGASGQHRGSSGRDRLPLPSTCYLVVVDFEGNHLSPPGYFTSFGPVRDLCKRGSRCGASVFVGLPSTWEAIVALGAGGFELPPPLQHG